MYIEYSNSSPGEQVLILAKLMRVEYSDMQHSILDIFYWTP